MSDPTVRLYVRVSTNQQELEGQIRELTDAATVYKLPVLVYQEKVSATGKADRAEYDRLLHDAAKGDHVLVWALDRFSRAERFTDAINAILDLEAKGVIFHSFKEPILNTPPEDDSGMMELARDHMLSTLSIVAKFEARRRQERTQLAMDEIKAGRRKTRSGRPPGRPQRVTAAKVEEIANLRASGVAYKAIAQRVGLPAGTCRAVMSKLRSSG